MEPERRCASDIPEKTVTNMKWQMRLAADRLLPQVRHGTPEGVSSPLDPCYAGREGQLDHKALEDAD